MAGSDDPRLKAAVASYRSYVEGRAAGLVKRTRPFVAAVEAGDVAQGDRWTGFHRIEKALWRQGSTARMRPVAAELLRDVERLRDKTEGLEYQPEQLANGANGLLDEVSASKITGEEDRHSHTDLYDFEANVSGSQTAFGLLAPALRARDAALARRIEARFDAVQAELARLRGGGRYPGYDTVGQAERRRLSRLVALAEPLSQVASRIPVLADEVG